MAVEKIYFDMQTEEPSLCLQYLFTGNKKHPGGPAGDREGGSGESGEDVPERDVFSAISGE